MSEKLYYIDGLAEVPGVARGNWKIKKIKENRAYVIDEFTLKKISKFGLPFGQL